MQIKFKRLYMQAVPHRRGSGTGGYGSTGL